MNRTVYVLGHKNPDTDSIVSAIGYAHLKRELGMPEAVAARAGMINPQTEYILDRFKVDVPVFLPDLIPKAEYYLRNPVPMVDRGSSLWEALSRMEESGSSALPIVDSEGRYLSTLHYSAFAHNILKKINPKKKAVIPTSVSRIVSTIKAQAVTSFDEDDEFKARIVVAALETEAFKRHLEGEPKEHCIVIVGDRTDIQKHVLEIGVRVMIITNGAMLDRSFKELAERNRVSVLLSPYDTSSTALLVLYSTAVETMGDENLRPVQMDTPLRNLRGPLSESPSRSVPVTDEDGKVMGIFTEGDLLRDPNIELILVDHNELGQAVEGAENYHILEIIDHHRIGSFATKAPITFINRVVGSTSTIVADMYRENHVPLPKEIAALLLCGILSDTIVFRSVTTTDKDRETAEARANIVDIDIPQLGSDILNAASSIGSKSAADIVRMDLKEYTVSDRSFTVSQVEVNSPEDLLERRAEIFGELTKLRKESNHYIAALMITDITELSSYLFLVADKDFESLVKYPEEEDHVYKLKDVLSRKKQLVPVLLELAEKALGA
jgi:manganese-dependent inorganic pyrophosphatase